MVNQITHIMVYNDPYLGPTIFIFFFIFFYITLCCRLGFVHDLIFLDNGPHAKGRIRLIEMDSHSRFEF